MDETIKNVIVGTAGHIDHGKSSLVEALTGTHPDRLAEEKLRGITIDLGFAFLEEGGVRLGFVDVPGHERFVHNMLAGVGGIDLVLLVISADESIKPQTREHFDICRLLGVRRGVIALTKLDLVERDALELVTLEVEDFVRASFLENASIVPVSAQTGEGVVQLKKELLRAAREAPRKNEQGHFRLPIDRVFAMKGFGTVVTGTTLAGTVAKGDEVELFPAGRLLRVRGVQSGGKVVERASAGQRTALNLAGIQHPEMLRGMVLAAPGRFRVSRRIDARVQLLGSAKKLKTHARVHFHQGTVETVADVTLLGESELLPGQSGHAQLRLQEPVLVLPGDRFIVRQFSPVVTIGGGVVLDAMATRHPRKDATVIGFLENLERGEPGEVLAALAGRAPLGLEIGQIVARTGWLEAEARRVVEALAAEGRVRIVDGHPMLIVPVAAFSALIEKAAREIETFHAANPLAPGILREELRARTAAKVRPEVFRAALEELAAGGAIELAGEIVKRAGAQVTLQPKEARAREQIEAAFANAGLEAPSWKDLLAQLPVETRRGEQLLQQLLREGTLIRAAPELVFHREALAQLRAQLQAHKRAAGKRLSVATFKELTGVSRKYAIPLLEYLDRERVTRRVGDERVIL
ncbi:MAG: selenocysteine-specific translation elongation factor [Candidatus Acidiferrales bacterium]